MKFRVMSLATTLVAIANITPLAQASTESTQAPTIVQQTCTGCHLPEPGGKLSRISHQRKTPEGWEMTIARMQLIHKLQISNQEAVTSAETKRRLVKYLADHQGLAPEEAAPYRYLLEQDLTVIESFDEKQAQMCGRCHSSARFALQRRTEDEWKKLVHYHLGQYPSTEYSLMGRDRDWLKIALEEITPELARDFPLQTQAWSDWVAAEKPALTGSWQVFGEMPGKGVFTGSMTSEQTTPDNYKLQFNGEFASGETLSGNGSAIVFTGYEWRARLLLNGQMYRQTLAADKTGNAMSGRMYLKQQTEIGLPLTLAKVDGSSTILAAIPDRIRPGETTKIKLLGTSLTGEIQLGAGLTLVSSQPGDNGRLFLTVTADKNVQAGPVAIKVGDATLADAVTIYNRIDGLKVSPSYAIARLGENGGSTPKSHALFTAIGVDYGADGSAGTDDDIEVGTVTATWSVAPFDEAAKHDRDVEFAGQIDPKTGVFTPAGAGPNPARTMSTNNAGNLKVIAVAEQDGHQVSGEGHLIVTVQRWNNPPLK